ncbi:MAG: glutamate racemase [Patescibacteria group bacterium]|nr:glutamate racemase [Patescibacteria group bacterium]MDD4610649.1 glutamate racemase [Patescibacteria group bacterium]
MIGVFDSGFGGLTVLKHFLSHLPEQDYIYLGDNARAPYGPKSPEIIFEYAREAVDFLFGKNCDLIIFACNTASAQALRHIQQEYLPQKYTDKRVLGVIRPIVEKIGSDQKINKVGVIGTKATIEAGSYQRELLKINPNLEITALSAPLLVPLVEEGWTKRPEAKMILRKYLKPLKLKRVVCLILACTHYPLLLKEVREIMGKRCLVPDPGKIVADSLADYLTRHPEFDKKSTNPKRIFYTTENAEKFKGLGEKYLGERIDNIARVEL